MLSTKNDNNPAALIRQQYDSLMGLTDVNALREAVKAVLVKSSISKLGLRKALLVLAKISELTSLQSYTTNFLLAADGDRVIVRRGGEHDDTRRRLPELAAGSV